MVDPEADKLEEVPLGYGISAVCYSRVVGICHGDYEIFLGLDQLVKLIELIKREYPELGI